MGPAASGAGWRRRGRARPPLLASGRRANRDTRGDTPELVGSPARGSGMEPTLGPAQPCSPGTGRGEAGSGLEGGDSPAGGAGEGPPLPPPFALRGRTRFFVVFVLFLIPSDWPPTKSGFQMPSREEELERGTVELSGHFLHPIPGACLPSCRTFVPRLDRFGSDTLQSRKPENVLPATALIWTTFEGSNR